MNVKLSRWVALILALFALIFFGYQIYQFFHVPYRTEIAEMYTYTDEVALEGVVLKDEQLIEADYSGVIQYEYPNAQKVSEGAAIATVYSSQDELELHTRAQQLDERIAVLKELQSLSSGGGADLQNLHDSVEQEQSDLLYQIAQEEYGSLSQLSSDFLTQLLKLEKELDPDLDFQEELSALQQEREELKAPEGQAIASPMAGYFTSTLDGYENVITPDSLETLSVEAVTSLLEDSQPAKTADNVIGKIIGSTDWQFAALIDTEELERIEEGESVSLLFSGNETNLVEATVEQIDRRLEEDTSAVLLSSSIMNEQVIDLRKETPVLYFGSGRGLRVSRDAVRMQDGKTGVYINSGRVVRFRQIDIVYTAEDYVISELHDESEYLQLYDEIIIEGKDELYDGKPV